MASLSVRLYKDHFKVLPRLLRWAHRQIPMFPYLARIEWRNLAEEHFPLQKSQVMARRQRAPLQRAS